MHWGGKDSSFPPRGVTSSDMHGDFSGGAESLAELVTGHEEPFAVAPPGTVKFKLLSVRPVLLESSLTGASRLLPLQHLQ